MRERYGINSANALAQPLIQEPVILPAAGRGVIIDFKTRKRIGPEEDKGKEHCEGPWAAFGQQIFVQEHEVDGKIIKKVAAVSIAFPGGSTALMAQEALERGVGEKMPITAWRGVNEGRKLIAMEKEVDVHNLSIIDAFIDASEQVILEKHEDPEHEYVQDFLSMQKNRRGALSMVRGDAKRILENTDFLHHTPFNPKYKNKGVYVQEMFMGEDGILMGVAPDGKIRPVTDIAADDPHKRWLFWLQCAIQKPGNRVIAHGEDDTVQDCGNNRKGCASFFQEMEKGIKTNFLEDTYENVVGGPILASSDKQEKLCDSCGEKKISEHHCKE